MATGHTITNTCAHEGCSCDGRGASVGRTDLCSVAIAALEADGWKFLANGTRRREGVSVTVRGNVTVNAGNYNSRTMALLSGDIPVEDLDQEELARGMCRNEDGSFPKRMPEMVPKVIVDRMKRELFERADEGLRKGLVDAVEAIVGIATNDAVAPGDRMRAAAFVLERVMGKTPDRVIVGQEKPFEVVLDRVARGPRTRAVPGAE